MRTLTVLTGAAALLMAGAVSAADPRGSGPYDQGEWMFDPYVTADEIAIRGDPPVTQPPALGGFYEPYVSADEIQAERIDVEDTRPMFHQWNHYFGGEDPYFGFVE